MLELEKKSSQFQKMDFSLFLLLSKLTLNEMLFGFINQGMKYLYHSSLFFNPLFQFYLKRLKFVPLGLPFTLISLFFCVLKSV